MIQWIDCPGQGCRDELLFTGSGCSATAAQTYLNCPCCLGWGSGSVCCSSYPSTLFSELLFQGFFDFHSEVVSGPLRCWLIVVPELHLHFLCLHNPVLLQKEVLSCTLCSCPLQLPAPERVCAGVGICVTAQGVGLGTWPCWGFKKASVKLSQVERSSFCQDSWLILPCWNCSLEMLHQHSRIIFN